MNSFNEKTAINKRVSNRYDELMREGKHGHYETMFNVVHEERAEARKQALEEAAQWQPMDTAPRDGTYVLVKGEQFDGKCAVVCWGGDWWYLDDGKNFEIALRGPEPEGWMLLPTRKLANKVEA